jgi:hypothetical protein
MSCFKNKIYLLLLIIFLGGCASSKYSSIDRLPKKEIDFISDKIFYNECRGKDELLISWNQGENFLSLGIGHFIWYKPGEKGPFTESFPALLDFMERKGKKIPSWLRNMQDKGYPWKTRKEFLGKTNSQEVLKLREFLKNTISLQLAFMFKRFDQALDKMLEKAPPKKRDNLEFQFKRIKNSKAGIYALVDYVNFKGEGISSKETYLGQGWGLYQILEKMKGEDKGLAALEEFVATAKEILKRRVDNAPPISKEKRWLPGWYKRLDSYTQAYLEIP